MRDDCIAAVEEALGRNLRRGESEKLESAVNQQMRLLARKDPATWAAKSQWDRLQEASQAASAALSEEANLKLRRTELQIAAHDRVENAVADMLANVRDNAKPGSHLKAISQLLAFDAGGRGMRSVETNAKAINMEAMGRLMPLWESIHGFAHLFENAEGRKAVIREMFGQDSGNSAAKAAVKRWFEVTDELRDRANTAGANIGQRDDWHYPQTHSQSRVAQAGGNKDPSAAMDHYIKDVMPLLDKNHYVNADGSYMNDEQRSEFLRHAWESIAMDGMNKMEPGKGTGQGGVANRGSEHRKLFFKDADSFIKYQGLYGDKNLQSVLTGHIAKISRDIALMETLGPNPEKTFKYFNDRTLQDEMNMHPAEKKRVVAQAKVNEALYDNVSGRTETINQTIADMGQTFRNTEVATKLGSVVITAITDNAGIAATAFANKVPMSEVFLRGLHYLNPANAEDRAVAGHMALGIQSYIGGNHLIGEDLSTAAGVGKASAAKNLSARAATATLTLNGAEHMWDNRRKALGSVLMSYLGKTVGEVEHFADLNQADHGILATKGIDEKVWQTWRLAEPEDWGMKHGVLTQRSVRDIPDSALAHLGDPQTLRRNASTALLGHILEEVGMGVMEAGARERTAMTLGTTKGTAMGELARSVMLFKGFSATMMMKHWARANSMPTGGGTAGYYATLLVTGTILGGLAIQLRNIVSGKDPENVLSPKFAAEAFMRGGGLGFYGDFLYSEATSHDTSFIPAVLGPAATEAENLWHLTGGNAFKAGRGERTDEVANLIRWGKTSIPVINNWYTKAAFDHLIWNNFQEASSPGYLDRMQARAEATRGTTYWWNPHDYMPQAAPDVMKAWQPERGAEQVRSIERVAENMLPSLE